ncbi:MULTISPECIES: FAD-dependent monooxygenase [Streptomyces]|uniref:FAD-dependent monooxygenase n=2 Tax=Streptomyces TaxID=1883 RepID=A0ABU4K9X7_9ACTN|nr:FAD-dependent monooxygenase [Streptomyces roseolus]MDX2294551.1 FAD-dependent monooxygenase [Streptomyces roseolus]
MRITIVGAGIGGLATATSLHAAGFEDVTVFEAAARPRPPGFGLNVLPNAVRELAELGLLDALRHHAVQTRELVLCTPAGRLVWREDRGLSAGYRWPQLSVSHARLHAVLEAEVRHRLGDRALVTGARFTGLDDGPGGTRAVFADEGGGTRGVETDVLVGADGIHSAVRASFYPDEGPPPGNGVTMHRGTVWAPGFLTGASMTVLGDDRRRLVLYPIDRDEATGRCLVNWVAAFPDASPGGRSAADVDGLRRRLLGEFGDWSPPEVDLARLFADTERIHRYPMTDRDPLPRWTFGRATLLGDAAHAMYPAGSNGATQAVVDARVLARHLATCSDPGDALRAYEADRLPQMTELQRSNRSMGPEKVLTLAHQRAPGGFERIEDVFGAEELAEISRGYAATGKFDQNWVNSRPTLSVGPRRRPAVRREKESAE